MSKIVFLGEAKAMLGQIVTAIGCCGEKEGQMVKGMLTEITPHGDAIVSVPYGKKGHTIPCLVNRNTLELAKEGIKTHSEITGQMFSKLTIGKNSGKLFYKRTEEDWFVVNKLGMNVRDAVVPKN